MQELTLEKLISNEYLKVNYYPTPHADQGIIFVGGSGDSRNTFSNVILELQKHIQRTDVFTFSFRGVEKHRALPLAQQTTDLKELIDFILKFHSYCSIVLICTSMGAFSTTQLLIDINYKNIITKAIYLDPADYYLADQDKAEGLYAWAGYANYFPTEDTVSRQLKNIRGKIKIHVVHFLLRNYSPDGYIDVKLRGSDNEGYFPRLNTKMVKSFYNYLPVENRGLYIEDCRMPHAFLRDGDLEKNRERVIRLIKQCVEETI